MAISLYDATVMNFLQTLGAVSGFLDKSLAHFQEHGQDPADMFETRLAPDMFPFPLQIVSVVHHSRGAIEGVQKGSFFPPKREAPPDWEGLQALVKDGRDALAAVTPDTVNALQGRDVFFGERKVLFTVEDFLLSFSLPQFYFHATTAYDLLRMKGAPVGKRDFMGRTRAKS